MQGEKNEVVEYYDRIAETYDSSRFGGSYGGFIDAQERKLLDNWLPGDGKIVELACGTGRLTAYATEGVDASAEMLRQCAAKFPNKPLHCAPGDQLPYADSSVEAIYCFHLMMHLEKNYIAKVLEECHRVLKPGGVLIFDFPSAKRRKLARRNQDGWHGNTAMVLNEVESLAPEGLKMTAERGILFLPIHVLPSSLRRVWLPLDNLLCRSWLKPWASYTAVKFVKR